jgi:hypothetical protein
MTEMVLCQIYLCVFNQAEYAYLEQTRPIFT